MDPVARMLTTLPHLTEHVIDQVGGLRNRPDDPSTPAWEAPLPLNQAAFDDANELWAVLAWTVRHIAKATGSTMPGPAAHAWRTHTGHPVGLPNGITAADGRYMVSVLARWIDAQLPYLRDADGSLYELDHTYARIRGRYPLKDRPTTSTIALCPEDRGTLIIRPPRLYGDEQVAVCERCGHVYTQDEHDQAAVRFAAIEAYNRAKARATKVAAHLVAKYRDDVA